MCIPDCFYFLGAQLARYSVQDCNKFLFTKGCHISGHCCTVLSQRMFRCFSGLQRMTLEIFYPNQAIVLQGEAADKFYIVQSGTVSTELYLGCGQPVRQLQLKNIYV